MKIRNLLNLVGILAILFITSCTGCNRVPPNNEGVLASNYGRNGKSDFKLVTGTQGFLGPGSDLYLVPMFEVRADVKPTDIDAKGGGIFTVDPTYTVKPVRGKGVDIVFDFQNKAIDGDEVDMKVIIEQILNPILIDSYKEVGRSYSTDSILRNQNMIENEVQKRFAEESITKGFEIKKLVSGFRPPKSMRNAIEARNNASLEAQKVQDQLEVARMLEQKAVIDARTNKIKSEGLSREVLQDKWIEAIRNTKNRVIITDGKTPVLVN